MTEETCHCGSSMHGSDHCPHCGCEYMESWCSVHLWSEMDKDLPDDLSNTERAIAIKAWQDGYKAAMRHTQDDSRG